MAGACRAPVALNPVKFCQSNSGFVFHFLFFWLSFLSVGTTTPPPPPPLSDIFSYDMNVMQAFFLSGDMANRGERLWVCGDWRSHLNICHWRKRGKSVFGLLFVYADSQCQLEEGVDHIMGRCGGGHWSFWIGWACEDQWLIMEQATAGNLNQLSASPGNPLYFWNAILFHLTTGKYLRGWSYNIKHGFGFTWQQG